ncbi:hypothetical protein OHS16_10920 [Streptomyces sp. NBC_00344]
MGGGRPAGSYPPPQQGFGPPPPQGFGPPPVYAPGAVPAPGGVPVPAQATGSAAAPAGPEFLATDPRNAVVIDAEGVSFEQHGRTADFAWRQIQHVHYKRGPFGNVLMVAVVLPDGRFFEAAVTARNQAKLQTWFTELAQVLGFYLAGRGS